jgi:hypothetical protein
MDAGLVSKFINKLFNASLTKFIKRLGTGADWLMLVFRLAASEDIICEMDYRGIVCVSLVEQALAIIQLRTNICRQRAIEEIHAMLRCLEEGGRGLIGLEEICKEEKRLASQPTCPFREARGQEAKK